MFIQLLSRLHRYAARRMLPALMLFALMLPGLAAAQSLTGAVHVMSANGLNLKADVRWLEGNGYRPIQIEVLPIVPAAADRTLTVEFHARDMYGGGSLRVGQDIEIPAGATRVVETLTVPNGAWNTYSLEVYDNGVYRKGLSVQAAPGNWGGRGWEEGLPNILVVRDQVPDSGQFTMLFPAASMIQNYGNASTINGQIQMPTIAALPAARLPDKWIDYTSLDILCLPLATLQQLAVAEPETLTAIVRWTTSGGNLWVSGVGNDFASLAEIERIIGLFPSVPTALAGPRPGWEWPAAARYGQPLDIVQTDNYAYNQAVEATMPGEMPATEAAIVPPTAPAPQFASRELGRGLVMALAPEDPFPGETQQWQWLFNHVGAQRYLWYKRLGQSNKRSNPDFWNWLILGVGLAPVTAFRVLITLFVLAIGPLNFYLLWKAGRLQLLLVVVPAFSLLVTGSLFAYAILSDGL